MQKHSYFLCKYLAQKEVSVLLVHTASEITDGARALSCFTEKEKRFITSVTVGKPQVRKFPGHYIYQSYLYSKQIYDTLGGFPDVDIIISKSMTAWYFIKKRNKKSPPIAINIHGYEFLQKQANLKMALQSKLIGLPMKWLNRNADYVFSYGGRITELVRQIGVPMEKIIEVPAAIENDWISKVNSGENPAIRHFLFIGRYERRKGIEELQEVIARLIPKYQFLFSFVGPIPKDKRFKHAKVTYHGTVHEKEVLKGLLRQADVLVCPSYAEGMPNVILEGMANGCAIIATDVGAVSLMVNDSNGWLIPPADMGALEDAMVDALSIDTNRLAKKKDAAVALVNEKYLWPETINILLEKLCSITHSKMAAVNSDETST
jgi:glycosyltransferase involved in cell wall biosynthesis